MRRKQVKPIRLTKQRALALLHAAARGVDEWEVEIEDDLGTTDLEIMRAAKAKDAERAAALDGMSVIRARYFGEEPMDTGANQLF